MGVKKSVVCTRARCASRRYTPASSPVAALTRRSRLFSTGNRRRTCARTCWLSFEAQPAQEESAVSLRVCSRDVRRHLLSGTSAQKTSFKPDGGEGRNRTYPPIRSTGATVLKTAATTRHASLSNQTIAHHYPTSFMFLKTRKAFDGTSNQRISLLRNVARRKFWTLVWPN